MTGLYQNDELMRLQLFLLSILMTAGLAFSQKRTVDVGSFSKVSLGINANLFITQGSNEKVTIDCSDSDFDKIEFEMAGDRLTIRRKNRNWGGDNFRDVDIYVTMKEIERISLSGSGSIKGENSFDTGDLSLAISGSGDMDLSLDSEDVEIKISGSGDISLKGNAGETAARISGSGKVRAEDLTVSIFEASISGSGSCYITVTEEIVANISGSGNVYYGGEPARVNSNSSGSGKIRKL